VRDPDAGARVAADITSTTGNKDSGVAPYALDRQTLTASGRNRLQQTFQTDHALLRGHLFHPPAALDSHRSLYRPRSVVLSAVQGIPLEADEILSGLPHRFCAVNRPQSVTAGRTRPEPGRRSMQQLPEHRARDHGIQLPRIGLVERADNIKGSVDFR